MSSTVQSNNDYLPGEYFSGGLSISGLGNGTDFNSMIGQLKKIEMIPTQRMLRWKADWRERQDAFRTVRESLSSLRDICNKMSTMDKFMTKTTASSKSDVATATAGSAAIENSYKLNVGQVATTSIWSLQHQYSSNTASVNNTDKDINFSYEYAGSVRTISVPPNTSLESFKNRINNDSGNPGVRASLIKGADGVTLQIKGMDQGEKNDLSILASGHVDSTATPPKTYSLAGFPPPSAYAPHSLSYKTDLGPSDKVNDSTSSQVFNYSYNGERRSVTILPGTTVTQFVAKLNEDLPAGVSVNTSTNADGKYEINFTGNVNGMALQLPKGTGAFSGLGAPTTISGDPVGNSSTYTTNLAPTDVLNTSGTAQTYTYTYDGQQRSVSVAAGATMADFVTALNADLPAGANASLTQNADGKYELAVSGDAPVRLTDGTGAFAALGSASSESGWHIQHSQNAKIQVDGWPSNGWLEVSSNTVEDVVEGVTFTLIGTGESIISVNTDTEAIQENIIQFIEGINTFRKTIQDLTKYDESKQTLDVKYSESLFEMQKGSILTGNYGIQMVSSRMKQATASMPPGFRPRVELDGMLSGDMFTSLSQIGIKTNAQGSGGDLFGMLELNTDPSLPMLDEVLKKNPEAVADFFAAVNKGVSDSSNFSYGSSMESMTRPGAYEVKYTLDANGVPTGTINGKKAVWDTEVNMFGLARKDPKSDDPDTVTAYTNGDNDWTANIEVIKLANNSNATMVTNLTPPAIDGDPQPAAVDTGGKFYYELGGKKYSVNVAANDTLGDIVGKINYSVSNPGVTAKCQVVGGVYQMTIESKVSGAGGPTVNFPVAGDNACVLKGSTSDWPTTQASGENAEVKVNGKTETHKTNEFESTTIPGATFKLKKTTAPGTPIKVVGEAHNDADGLYVKIDNITPGGPYTGQIRIKQGKIPEILEMLNGPPSKPEEGMLGSKGTIQVLLDNYDKIVEGIDKKITRETDRLTKWERTQRLRFSRLEATLKQYEGLQKTLESQIKQLGSGSK